MIERFGQNVVEVPLSSGCQCVPSVEDQTVVDVVPGISPIATDVPRAVTSVLTAPSGSSGARRCQVRPAQAEDPGGAGAVNATGSWRGRSVGRASVGAVADTADGLAAATSGSVEAAGRLVSPH